MTRIDQIIADALAGSPETHVAILAREVLRLREAPTVVVPEIMLSDISDECSAMLCDDREAFRRGALWAQKFITSKARAIPADRVMGEGERKVDSRRFDRMLADESERPYLLELERYVRTMASLQNWQKDTLNFGPLKRLDALRANQGGADHD